MNGALVTGGCQCGAVRYHIGWLGRSAVCHCRMCQKATGNVFGIFITARDVTWTRGEPARFRSSNKAERLFCAACGTPIAAQEASGDYEFAVGTFDDPSRGKPSIEVHLESKSPFFHELTQLPPAPAHDQSTAADHDDGLISCQHPDHDTEEWSPAERSK